MKNLQRNFLALCFGLFAGSTYAADEVSLFGTIETTFCAQACGICCPTHQITDTSGEIILQVGNSFVDVDLISGDSSIHRFTGSFFETTGQCGVGECTLFAIESIDKSPPAEVVYDNDQEELTVSSGFIKDTNEHYAFSLRPPFNISFLMLLTEDSIKAQTQSCAAPGSLCETGTSCVSYYGIAGANGPLFKSCEISCAMPGASCGVGQSCVTIADGPGQVCRAD
jgi:hypothetical protein